MVFNPVISITISPGSSYFYPGLIAPTSKVIVSATSSGVGGGVILGYADVIVVGAASPSGTVAGRIKSLPINDVPASFLQQLETQQLGGWFIRIYAVNRVNGNDVVFRVFVEE